MKFFRTRLPLIALGLVLVSAVTSAQTAQQMERIKAAVDTNYSGLEQVYLHLHANPELGFQEEKTASYLAERMRLLKFQVTEHVGRTGIVAVLHNGDGNTVMIRTELDALSLQETTGLPYASQVKARWEGKESFVAQACGHDAHMAWWLGAAEALVAVKDTWHGTLLFVGQPAEEEVSGAAAMIADGLFTRFPRPDYAFAAHVGNRPAGLIFIKEGTHSSAVDNLRITFTGVGGHGARPNVTVDPVVMASKFVVDVQSIISRERDPNAFGVITVGSFQSGAAGNVIPKDAVLQLTLRSFAPEVRELLMNGVKRTADGVASMSRAPKPPTIEHMSGTAALENPPALAEKAAGVMKRVFGADRVSVIPATQPGGSTSEDFSEYVLAGIPSVYFNIGGGDPAKIAEAKAHNRSMPANHSPDFSIEPKPAIETGSEVLATAALMALQGNPVN